MVPNAKPLGIRNYGSIPHLPGSRMGPGDHACHSGQERICCVAVRDRHDRIIVQEKLDGSNVGVALVGGNVVALTRAGYVANTSPYPQHHLFSYWVARHKRRFSRVLEEGERLVGEWLAQAHGTRYELRHEPFVAFDLMRGHQRSPFEEVRERVGSTFVLPLTISEGPPVSIDEAMRRLGRVGGHGAIDPIEGAMWRVERNELIDAGRGGERRWKVDFLAKYVRPEKEDGSYLSAVTGDDDVWNVGELAA